MISPSGMTREPRNVSGTRRGKVRKSEEEKRVQVRQDSSWFGVTIRKGLAKNGLD